MNTNRKVSRFKQPKSTRLASTIAICVALATVGYGVVEVAAHFVQVPLEAPASVAHRSQNLNPEPQAAASPTLPVTSEIMRVVTSGDRIGGPRECALDNGITEACTFN